MRDCDRAAQALASARVYWFGFQIIKKAYFDAVIALDGFPGTEDELQRFLEAMRCVEATGARLYLTALDMTEGSE